MLNSPEIKKCNILLLVWGGIGNMVMALPIIKAVLESKQFRAVTVLAQKKVMLELLEGKDDINKIALDDIQYQGFFGKPRLIGHLKEQQPNVVISLVPSPRIRSGLLAWLSGAKVRVIEDRYGSAFFNNQVCPKGNQRHYLRRNIKLLNSLGMDDPAANPQLFTKQGNDISAAVFLEENGTIRKKQIIGIHPGAGQTLKKWPAEKFVVLGKELISAGHQVIIFGGPDELALVTEVAEGIGPETAKFIGDDNFSRTLGLIKKCKLFVSNDSGLAHCSAALGVLTVVIFGPTDPEICAPLGSHVTIIKHNADCGPCYDPGFKLKCKKPSRICLDIPVEKVLAVVNGIVKISQLPLSLNDIK